MLSSFLLQQVVDCHASMVLFWRGKEWGMRAGER